MSTTSSAAPNPSTAAPTSKSPAICSHWHVLLIFNGWLLHNQAPHCFVNQAILKINQQLLKEFLVHTDAIHNISPKTEKIRSRRET